MSEYKISKGPKGRNLYFRKDDSGFKMISVRDIPENILKTMEPEKPVSDQAPEFRKCVFCGARGTEERFINLRKVYLCLDDYGTKTTGEVVAQMRSQTMD